MKEKKKDFLRLLEDLCYIYEDYIDEGTFRKLKVCIDSNTIKMYLINDSKIIIDNFGLAFNQKEKDSHMYISVALIKILFGSRIIYNKDNVFFDDIDNPSLEIIVSDKDILNRIISVLGIYRDIDFYDKIDNGRKVRNKINRNRSANLMDDRVNITRRLLKIRSKK